MSVENLRRLRAFFQRDFYNETSYRFSFLISIGGVLVKALVFFYLSEFIEAATQPALDEYGGDYFSFVIIGIALGGYFSTGLTGFARGLREAQTTGTLEALMMTPTPISVVVVGSAVWSYAYTTFRVFVYLLFGALFLGLNLSNANYLAALAILILSIISFAGIGIITAGVIMVVKRGDPVTALFGSAANLVGGVFFPIAVLPGWLQALANLLPITYSLRAMRLALLDGASWQMLAPDLLMLVLFCLVLFPTSLLIFRYAVERARRDGSLAHY